jgi:hypothetical protein
MRIRTGDVKALRRCPFCGKEFGARELRVHVSARFRSPDGITLLPGRKRESLHVLEGLLILQTDLVDQLYVDNDALL